MTRARKRLLCWLLGRHKWDHDWRDIDITMTWFQRIDCQRCGLAIDGAALKRISETHPSLTRDL